MSPFVKIQEGKFNRNGPTKIKLKVEKRERLVSIDFF